MSKDVGGLHDLSSKKSAVTKVKAKQHVNFKSWGLERRHTHEAIYDTDSCLGIHFGRYLLYYSAARLPFYIIFYFCTSLVFSTHCSKVLGNKKDKKGLLFINKCVWQDIAAWFVTYVKYFFHPGVEHIVFWKIPNEPRTFEKLLLSEWKIFYFHQWLLRAPCVGKILAPQYFFLKPLYMCSMTLFKPI